jgi:hypothetical protein
LQTHIEPQHNPPLEVEITFKLWWQALTRDYEAIVTQAFRVWLCGAVRDGELLTGSKRPQRLQLEAVAAAAAAAAGSNIGRQHLLLFDMLNLYFHAPRSQKIDGKSVNAA